jgi:hypothetical protein
VIIGEPSRVDDLLANHDQLTILPLRDPSQVQEGLVGIDARFSIKIPWALTDDGAGRHGDAASTDLPARGRRNRDLCGQGLGDRVLIRPEGINLVRIQIERTV